MGSVSGAVQSTRGGGGGGGGPKFFHFFTFLYL